MRRAENIHNKIFHLLQELSNEHRNLGYKAVTFHAQATWL